MFPEWLLKLLIIGALTATGLSVLALLVLLLRDYLRSELW